MIGDAGYLFSAEKGRLCCFACGDEKLVLNQDEIAAVEHARTSPHCPYLRRKFGDDFTHIIQEMEKCGGMEFERLIEHLPRWQHHFSAEAVQRSCKANIVTCSRDDLLEETRAEKYATDIRPACDYCKKANSATQSMDCCSIKWCGLCQQAEMPMWGRHKSRPRKFLTEQIAFKTFFFTETLTNSPENNNLIPY